MPQEIENRLMLAATIVYDDSEVPSFIANQGFASVQHENDAGLGLGVCILRPEEFPATPDNMLVEATAQIQDGFSLPAGAIPPSYTIVPAGGLSAVAPYAANVRAAAQPGDILIIVEESPAEATSFAMICLQVTPADG